MPALVKDMGRAVPSFYGSVKNAGEKVKPNLPIFAVLILVGVAVVFILRRRTSSTNTGAALTITPDNSSDVSTIDNLTQAVNALTQQWQGGGATTPVTPPITPPGSTPPSNPPTPTGGGVTINPATVGKIWGSDVPASWIAVDPGGTRIAALFKKLNLGYGTVVNPKDIQAAFNVSKTSYGSVLEPKDIQALLTKEHV